MCTLDLSCGMYLRKGSLGRLTIYCAYENNIGFPELHLLVAPSNLDQDNKYCSPYQFKLDVWK